MVDRDNELWIYSEFKDNCEKEYLSADKSILLTSSFPLVLSILILFLFLLDKPLNFVEPPNIDYKKTAEPFVCINKYIKKENHMLLYKSI